MPIVKKNETLAISFKVDRKLHDKLDEIKQKARKLGVEYDPSEALSKALQKDIDSANNDLKTIATEEKSKPVNHVDKI